MSSGRLGLDQTVTWRARHFGRRAGARSLPLLRHLHEFVATAKGTAMSDEVEPAAPGGPLGRLVERALLTDYVAGLIDERNAYLADHADLMGR